MKVQITKNFSFYHEGDVVDVSPKLGARYLESNRAITPGSRPIKPVTPEPDKKDEKKKK